VNLKIELPAADLELLCRGFQGYSNNLMANIQSQVNAQMQLPEKANPDTKPDESSAGGGLEVTNVNL